MKSVNPFRRNKALAVQRQIVVSDIEDMVTLKIGDSTLEFSYQDAFRLAQWLRVHGKRAKRFAGDEGRSIDVGAILTDAAEDEEMKANLHQI